MSEIDGCEQLALVMLFCQFLYQINCLRELRFLQNIAPGFYLDSLAKSILYLSKAFRRVWISSSARRILSYFL